MFLDGAASKWSLYLGSRDEIPNAWEKDVANPASSLGLKELFLKQFTPVNYRRFYESKLKNRYQVKRESVSEYYYDILDLCSVVKKTMPEAEKVDQLFRGLRSELIEKLWGARITTCTEFLQAQHYKMMTNLLFSRKNVYPIAVMECEEG